MRDQPQLSCDRRRLRPGCRDHHQFQGVSRGGTHEAVEGRRATGSAGYGVGEGFPSVVLLSL